MSSVPVLTYHRVCTDASGPIAEFSVTPAQFAEQLDLIESLGFHVIDANDLAQARTKGLPVAPQSVVVTFDDGFRDNLDAFESLAKRQMPATLFVSTGLLDGIDNGGQRLGPMLRPNDLNDIRQLGGRIGCHGHEHLELDACSTTRAEFDIRTSRRCLQDWLGAPVTLFAYPYGYNSAGVRGLVENAGFDAAYAVGNRASTTRDSPWAISRFLIRADTSTSQLVAWLSGRSDLGSGRERLATKGWRLVRKTRRHAHVALRDPTLDLVPLVPMHVAAVQLDSGTVTRRPSTAENTEVAGALCLVRSGRRPVGITTVMGRAAHDNASLIAHLERIVDTPAALPAVSDLDLESVTIVVASRDRADSLRVTLPLLLSLDHPRYEVIVVDNAPSTTATRDLVTGLAAADSRLRYVCEPLPGLSRARNCGLDLATTSLVTFADDDIEPEPDYLRQLCEPFSMRPEVWCVSGLVLPAELDTTAQRLFEEFGGFSAGVERREFQINMQPRPSAIFPYSPGLFGTGGCLAFRTRALRSLGGFDPVLGAGTASVGGEDLDITMRVIRAGATLIYQPTAVVWHHHHRELDALTRQVHNYGAGLTAAYTKLMLRPSTALQILQRLPAGLAMLLPGSEKNSNRSGTYPTSLIALEMRGLVTGWVGYLRSAVGGGRRARNHAASAQHG